jgi:hypothetical protein
MSSKNHLSRAIKSRNSHGVEQRIYACVRSKKRLFLAPQTRGSPTSPVLVRRGGGSRTAKWSALNENQHDLCLHCFFILKFPLYLIASSAFDL